MLLPSIPCGDLSTSVRRALGLHTLWHLKEEVMGIPILTGSAIVGLVNNFEPLVYL